MRSETIFPCIHMEIADGVTVPLLLLRRLLIDFASIAAAPRWRRNILRISRLVMVLFLLAYLILNLNVVHCQYVAISLRLSTQKREYVPRTNGNYMNPNEIKKPERVRTRRRTSLNIDSALWKNVGRKAIDLDISLTEAVESALEMWLEAKGEQIQRFVRPGPMYIEVPERNATEFRKLVELAESSREDQRKSAVWEAILAIIRM